MDDSSVIICLNDSIDDKQKPNENVDSVTKNDKNSFDDDDNKILAPYELFEKEEESGNLNEEDLILKESYDRFEGQEIFKKDEQELQQFQQSSRIIGEDIVHSVALDFDEPGPPAEKKRKKRTKDEIEAEKLQKEVQRVQRQMQAAKNSKCEQYLFCYMSTRILSIDENLQTELESRFTERGIKDQLVFESTTANMMRVIWRRKRIEASIGEGKLHKSESLELQCWFYCILSGETFTVLAKTKNGLLDYLRDQAAEHKTRDARPTLVVIGKHSVRENQLSALIFEAYERFRAQIRVVKDALDFSFLVVQMHRALAKYEKKSDKKAEAELLGTSEHHFTASKGISQGPGIVTDWWARMLEHVQRLSEEQRRAIVRAHPNPIKLMDSLLDVTNSPGSSMFKLSEIQGDSGRKLGPVLAQRLYKMLTSLSGEEIIDLGASA